MVDDPQRRCPDISLARDALGWEPKIDADDGLVANGAGNPRDDIVRKSSLCLNDIVANRVTD